MTDLFQLYIIELPKIARFSTNTELDTWVKFIKNPEVISMSDEKNNDSLKAAKKVLEDISQDEHEIYLAELREKYIMDQKAIAAKGFDNGVQVGLEQGIEQGIAQGIEQGLEQGIAQIVINMFRQNVPLEDISKFTALDIDKIKDIIEKNKNS